jgi:hypothetical protein
MMMYFLHGWIAHARQQNQYFVVDQLAAHAVSLLRFIDQLDGLPTRNQQHAKMFLYTKSWLKLEVSTCRMSRGDVYTSVNLAREVLRELWTHPPEPVREALALQAASSIVVDLNEAGTDASTMRPWALFALRAVIASESLNAKGAALAFEKAYLVRSSLNGRTQYREDAVIARVIHELDEMITRDPSDELRPNAVMDELVKQIDAGDLGASVDERLATLRTAANDYDKHTFDCIEVDIALKRRQFDEALRGIDELVARPLHQTHGARPLSVGLVQIYRTLENMIAVGIGPVQQMQLKSSRVRARAEELHQQIISQDAGGL